MQGAESRHRRRIALAAAVLLLVAGALLLVKLSRIGWFVAHSPPPPAVIPIEVGSEEAFHLSSKSYMFAAWVHNIRIDQVVPFHQHPRRPEIVAILRGKARVRGLRKSPTGDAPVLREEILGPGNIVFSPATAVHEFANVGDEPLWSLVFQSPTFRGNFFLNGAPPPSDLDFLVIPWQTRAAARGASVPDWALRVASAPQASVPTFRGIPGNLLRGRNRLAGSDPDAETWMVLLSGEGTLVLEGREYAVRAPTWVYAPRDGWSLRGDGGEFVALEFLVPGFDLRLFLLGLYEQYLDG
jgi:mannose-6-phosphate isomerase-like protein (cupin superfamily)